MGRLPGVRAALLAAGKIAPIIPFPREGDSVVGEKLTEADTCRKFVTPRLIDAGWDTDPHSIAEQWPLTEGRIVLLGGKPQRIRQRRADYLLRYTRDFCLAVVEAKAEDISAGEGMQQAKEYAEMLGIKFAYATNGHDIIEFDYIAGKERTVDTFPAPEDLWH